MHFHVFTSYFETKQQFIMVEQVMMTRYVQGIFLIIVKLLSFVFIVVLCKNILRDLANLTIVTLPHIVTFGCSIIHDKYQPIKRKKHLNLLIT